MSEQSDSGDSSSNNNNGKPDVNPNDDYGYKIDPDTGKRLVVFLENDKGDPMQWPNSRKWLYTLILGLLCFTVAFASAVVTGNLEGPQEYFGVSKEVMILTVSLLVLGFGVGPLVFAPFSEEVGRQIIYAITMFFAVVFIVPCAVAKNIGTLLVCRFLDGLSFSAPMTLIGGSLGDMWNGKERGVAMSIFSAAPYLGPAVGPLVGGFIGDNLYWRWVYYILLIFTGVVYLITLLVPETHHDTILTRRAKKLRKLTGDDSYASQKELTPSSLAHTVHVSLLRPFQLLFEPIVFLFTLYNAVIYGLLYMFFFAYPVVFVEGKGWTESMTGLMFIPIMVGVISATVFSPYVNIYYVKSAKKYVDRGETPPAELRLVPMMAGCWLVPIGLFIFAWTSYPHISWVGPCLAGLPCGVGFILIYNSANNYIVDSYLNYAASALAAKTFVRSVWGAAVPLFTIQMYHRLGYQWASSLIAFIALACCPIPIFFYIYGARIRARSKYAYCPEVPVSSSTPPPTPSNNEDEKV